MSNIFKLHSIFVVIVVLRTVFCVYRAATQSITHDEAFSYSLYISGNWSNFFKVFDANNHILYTILARLTVGVLGVSELTLRLPSVIAGIFFSVGAYRLLSTLRSTWIRGLALAVVLFHPLILDFSIAARGYGLCLALLVWSAVFLISRRYVSAGVLLGLAMSANLTAVFPAAAAVLSVWLLGGTVRSAFRFAIPSAIVFSAICYLTLRHATPANFYVGANTLSDSIHNLILLSIRTNFAVEGLFGTDAAVEMIQFIILPITLVICLLAVRGNRGRAAIRPVCFFVISLILLIAFHYLFGIRYPIDRTGLWLVAAFLISWAFCADQEPNLKFRTLHGILFAILLLQFASQLQTRYFTIWAFDHDTRQVAEQIERETFGSANGSVRVSASFTRHPSMEFYRKVLPIPALQPIVRVPHAATDDFDYYVLSRPEMDEARIKNLEVIEEDLSLGSFFARPKAPTSVPYLDESGFN